LKITPCPSPQPVAIFYTLSRYIQNDQLVCGIYQFVVDIYSVERISKLQFCSGTTIELEFQTTIGSANSKDVHTASSLR
jgi:hypothetical protein